MLVVNYHVLKKTWLSARFASPFLTIGMGDGKHQSSKSINVGNSIVSWMMNTYYKEAILRLKPTASTIGLKSVLHEA
ncbi:hypothetical protein ACLOJK_012709, partial [Asimina triloba]